MNINKSIIMGLVRHALTTGGGIVAANGWLGLEPDNVQQLVGIGMAIVGFGWSYIDKQAARSVDPFDPVVPVTVQADESISADAFNQVRRQNAKPTQVDDYSVNRTGGYLLSDRSRNNLVGVNPLLQQIVKTAIELTPVDFAVTEGVRSGERQAELVKANKSWVKVSRHESGDAVDLAAFPDNYPNDVSWEAKHYEQINEAMQKAAQTHGCRLTWGGHWKVRDYMHFQFESELADKSEALLSGLANEPS